MHIAIEAPDGAGKTTTACTVAKALGFTFVEKPLHFLTDPDGGTEQYSKFTQFINHHTDLEFRSMIYGAGNYYVSQLAKHENIVTDRHLCSTYYIDSTGKNQTFFDHLVDLSGKPDLTVVLYAPPIIRQKRILSRNPYDPDLKEKQYTDLDYQHIFDFLKRYRMNYIWLDNSHLTQEETVSKILKTVQAQFGFMEKHTNLVCHSVSDIKKRKKFRRKLQARL